MLKGSKSHGFIGIEKSWPKELWNERFWKMKVSGWDTGTTGEDNKTAHDKQELHLATCSATSSLQGVVGQNLYFLISSLLHVFSGSGCCVYLCICIYIAIHVWLYRSISLSIFFIQLKENYLPLLQQDLDAVCGLWLLVYFITIIKDFYNTEQGLSKCCVAAAKFTLTDTTCISWTNADTG